MYPVESSDGKNLGTYRQAIHSKGVSQTGISICYFGSQWKWELFFIIHDSSQRFSAQDILVFLKKLIEEHRRRHLTMIIGRAPYHIAQKVQELLSAQKKLDVFYLPPRSLEFNPAKKIWHHLKHHELKSHRARRTKGLKILDRKEDEKNREEPG